MDPTELGIDMASLLFSDEVKEAETSAPDDPGLVHEPSFGEPQLAGYVDSHNAPAHNAAGQTFRAVESVHGE